MITVKQKTRPRVRFSPAGYKRARREYDQGDERKLIAMMEEAKVDSHVSGCLIGRRAGYKRKWNLTQHDDSADVSDQRRDWLTDVLQRLGVNDLMEAIHDGRLFSYSVIDFEWEVTDGRQVPVRFKHFDPHHFRRDDDGALKIDFGWNEMREIEDGALLVDSRKQPVMLPILRDYIMKEFGLEAWSAFLETFGEAFIIGRYPPGASDDFKDEVEEAVQELGASSRGTAPDGTEFDVVETSRSTGDHLNYTERADTGISIALLGHANAVQNEGGIEIGGNQQSYQVRFELAKDDMQWIEPKVNELLGEIWRRNFGGPSPLKFELNKSKPVDPQMHSEMIDMAYRHGAEVHIDEYKKLGLRVRHPEGEEWIRKPETGIDTLMTQ